MASLNQSDTLYRSLDNQSNSFNGNQSEHLEGYDIDTIQEVQQDFYCPICFKLMRNVKQMECGHVLCEGCLQKHLKALAERGADFFCPVDRKPVDSTKIVSVPFVDRLILSSQVKCTYECDWEGDLGNLQDHIPHCEFSPTDCPNGQCHESIQRNKIDEHLKICKYSVVVCKYQHYGCKIKILGWEVTTHEKQFYEYHIDLIEASHSLLQVSNSEFQSSLLESQKLVTQIIDDNQRLQGKLKNIKTKHDTELKSEKLKLKMENDDKSGNLIIQHQETMKEYEVRHKKACELNENIIIAFFVISFLMLCNKAFVVLVIGIFFLWKKQ